MNKLLFCTVRTDRLREIAHAIADGNRDELTMRVPAEPDRDADLVIMSAAEELDALRADLAAVKAQRDALREGADVVLADLALANERIAEMEGQNVCFMCGGPGVQHWCETHRPSLLRATVRAKPPFTQEQIDRGAAMYRSLTGRQDDSDAAIAGSKEKP